MKVNDILNEASYPGNIGAMEVVEFYRVADETQKDQLATLLKQKEIDTAWKLILSVTGRELHPMGNTGE